jgi:aspartate racemase
MAKLIGMIGGVSWESTVLYYQLINQAIRDRFGGLNSAKLLISSLNYAPMVDLENQGNWSAVGDILVITAQNLERAGADFLIIGCNTLHKVSSVIEAAIQIPFLHIADAVGEALVAAKILKVGLLGTQFTMEDGFYADRLRNKFNLEVVVPDSEARSMIDNIIYKELCLGKIVESSRVKLSAVMASLAEAGAAGIILGCTELGMIIEPGDAPVGTYDSTVLHAAKTVALSLQ